MKKTITLCGFVVICICCSGLRAEERTISVFAMDLEPYFWQDEQGRWRGLYIELADALARHAGFQPQYSKLPWNRGIEYLKRGQLDMTPLLSKTPEREKFIHFIGVSAFEQTVIIVKQDQLARYKGVQTLDDLVQNGYVWGIRQQAFYSTEFNHRLETDAAFREHFEAIAIAKLNVEKVKKNRISGAFVDLVGISYVLKNQTGYQGLALLAVPFFPPADIHFGVSKNVSLHKLERLKASYSRLNTTGVFKAIVDRWVDFPK